MENFRDQTITLPSLQVISSLRLLEKSCDVIAAHVVDNLDGGTDICFSCDPIEYECLLELSSKIGRLLSEYSEYAEKITETDYKQFLRELVNY